MSLTDPVADMLTRIRNACSAGHRRVDMPVSKLKTEVARLGREAEKIGVHAGWPHPASGKARSAAGGRGSDPDSCAAVYKTSPPTTGWYSGPVTPVASDHSGVHVPDAHPFASNTSTLPWSVGTNNFPFARAGDAPDVVPSEPRHNTVPAAASRA